MMTRHAKICISWLALALAVGLPAIARADTAVAQRAGAATPGAPATALDPIIEQAKAAMRADPARAVDLARQAERESLALPASEARALAIGQAKWLQGEAYLRLNDPDHAAPVIDEALKSLAGIRKPIKLKGDLLVTRGGINTVRANVGAALEDYQTAHNIFRQLGEARSQAIALQYIASLYREAGDLQTAMRYDSQSTEVYGGDPGLAVSTYNNRGNALRQMDRPIEAEAQYRLALGFARKMSSPLLEARILGNIARGQLESDNVDAADRTIAEGLSIAQSGEARGWRPQLLAIAAQAAFQRNNIRLATSLITQSFAGVDVKTTSLAYVEAHGTAYNIFLKAGRPDLAVMHLAALKRLDDKKASLAASANTALMAARFDYANQDLKIAKLKQDELRRNVAFERARARTQQFIFVGVVIATLIVVSMLIFGLMTIRRSRNEVRAANIDLESTNVALEKALAAKTEFLATTSHEIRTPLNGILGMTQVMLADQSLSAPTRDRIGVVHGAGVTMRALVDDILDVAKMETGNLTLEAVPMDLHVTLRDVSRLWEEQASARGIEFRLDLADCPQMIEGDAARLRQIVFNLLSNALKFTAHGSVTIKASAIGADQLRLEVSDTGIGIPADKQEEIFESFKQVDAGTTRKFGGTGLGLSICRNLARAMGGDVDVTSRPGEGSTFAVTIPLTLAASPTTASSVSTAQDGLLIVDRNPISRSMMRAMFESRAGEISFAGSAEEAVAAIGAGGLVHVLIDDATMKVSDDAAAAVAQIAAAGSAAGASVALLWPEADEAGRAALASAGLTRIISKPIKGAQLVEMLYPEFGNEREGTADPLVSRAA